VELHQRAIIKQTDNEGFYNNNTTKKK